MTYQLEVNIVYANQGGGLLGHMYVNLNDANGVKLASYGFNPEGGITKWLSPFRPPIPRTAGVLGYISDDSSDIPNQTYRFDINDAQFAHLNTYAENYRNQADAGNIRYNFWYNSCVDFVWSMLKEVGIASTWDAWGADFAPGNNGDEIQSLYEQFFGLSDGVNTFSGYGKPYRIYGGSGDETINGNATGDSYIEGNAGNDTLNGGTGNDVFYGGTGDDAILVGTGTNTIVCGPGAVTVIGGVEVAQAAYLWGQSNALPTGTRAEMGAASDYVDAQGVWHPYVEPNLANPAVAYFSGVQAASATFDAPANYHGSTFNDVAVGAGNNTIFGGTGNSYFFLSNGDNWLDAGGGNLSTGSGQAINLESIKRSKREAANDARYEIERSAA